MYGYVLLLLDQMLVNFQAENQSLLNFPNKLSADDL